MGWYDNTKPEDDEVEIDAADDGEEDDDEDGVVVGGDDDTEFETLKLLIVVKLVRLGQPTSAGKLGHELNAKKKPVAAALFALLESGDVLKSDGLPPKWQVAPEVVSDVPLVDADVPARYAYDDTKKRARPGPKASAADFATLKNLVRSKLKGKGAGGTTAGALGYALGASKNVVNAALYACEKEGLAWTVSDKESGARLRWEGQTVKCNAPLPAAFAYGDGAVAGGAAIGAQPALKKARTAPVAVASGACSTGDDFEDLKLLLRGRVESCGKAGVTSGKLGYELGANRKAVNAALHACAAEGTVRNVTEEGMPRWVSVLPPPTTALSMGLPAKFSYKGNDAEADEVQPPSQIKKSSSQPKVGKTTTALQAVAYGGSAAGGVNPIAFLNEWSQKNKKQLTFRDLGADGSGNFQCQAVVDGRSLSVYIASNKKAAKALAAQGAIQELDI